MADQLAKHFLYVDDFNKLRILDPIVAESTVEFKDQCIDFINKIESFQSVTKTAYEIFESIAEKVEWMKMKYTFSQSQLESVERRNREERQVLESQVHEAQIECERLKMELQSLERQEAEQRETIQNILKSK